MKMISRACTPPREQVTAVKLKQFNKFVQLREFESDLAYRNLLARGSVCISL